MSCSCGNATCPCGIPCCCSEELCKCDACAIALQRLCKICNKPLITDLQTDKDTCSCFEVGMAALTLENKNNPQWRIGNIPMPIDYYVCGKLIVNMIIPIPHLRQLALQRPISLISTPPLIQTNSRNILPSDTHIATSIPSGEDPGMPSTANLHQLDKSTKESNYHASSGICPTAAQNVEISCKETCPPLVLQSTDEKPADTVQSTKSEIEGRGAEQESTFYLPSVSIGNISYPVGLTEPVWRLPNSAFCIPEIPDSNLKIWNPFYGARLAPTIQTMTSFEERCSQQAPNLNDNSPALKNNVALLQMNGRPSDPTKITEQSDLEFNNEHVKFDASLATGAGNGFSVFPSSGNTFSPILTEEGQQCAFNTSNKILGNYLKPDKTSDAISTGISPSGMQEHSGIQSASAFINGACSIKEMRNINLRNRHPIPSPTQNGLEYFDFSNNTIITLQDLINMQKEESFEENEYPQNDNFGSFSVNDKRNDDIDPIPLYIDTFTNQKMEKLLKHVNYSSASSPISNDVIFPKQNSGANVKFSNSNDLQR